MTILITGSTGTVGSALVRQLAKQHVPVNALTRDPSKANFPSGVTAVAGDMLDVESMRKALKGVSTLFLLNAVSKQELTEAVVTLNLARDAGIKSLVYFSVFNGEAFTDVPHFTSKYAVERMLAQTGIPATILRPNCFMQNDAVYFKDALLGPGLYPFPIGEKGVSMVDVRDIAEVAAGAVLQREQALQTLLRISAIVTGHFGIVTGASGIVTGKAHRGGLRGCQYRFGVSSRCRRPPFLSWPRAAGGAATRP